MDGEQELLRGLCIAQLRSFRVAIDRLLEQPGRYFDPAILPDPARDGGFCERYTELCQGIRQLVPRDALPKHGYQVAHGEGLPVGGCLLRSDMEAMWRDVTACIEALRQPLGKA